MFGGSASPAIFISLNALLAWAAKNKRSIEALIYVDDSFGIEEKGRVEEFAPYGKEYPTQQARLLRLWDEIGVPHKQKKQVYGQRLTIPGIDVDVSTLHSPTQSERI